MHGVNLSYFIRHKNIFYKSILNLIKYISTEKAAFIFRSFIIFFSFEHMLEFEKLYNWVKRSKYVN